MDFPLYPAPPRLFLLDLFSRLEYNVSHKPYMNGGVSMVEITLLGTGGTLPVKGRWLSSAMIRCMGTSILFDCGEGTQMAAREADLPLGGVDILCLSHFHGDHVAGLPGFLLSMGHEGRRDPVDIYGPVGLTEVVSALRILAPFLPFEVRLHEIRTDQPVTLQTIGHLSVSAFPLEHSVPCLGYTVDLFRPGRFDVEKARFNHVPQPLWSLLQKTDSATDETGRVYTRDMVLGPDRKGIHILLAQDTRPTALLEKMMSGRALCILEGMYGSDDKREKAVETFHMTFTEVAFMASRAKPDEIWFTHYSPSLPDPETYIEDAQTIFPRLKLGTDGMKTILTYPDDSDC